MLLKFKNFVNRYTHVFGMVSVLLLISTATKAENLKVVELFTSQGCYSCPAADELIGELSAADDNILSLEFHVDYWNDLVYGSAGRWIDPFSSAEYTKRQWVYANTELPGNNGVYTPQAVINGNYGAVGSHRRSVTRGLKMESQRPVSVNIERLDADTLEIDVKGDSSVEADVYLVQFLKKTETNIPSGENKGKIMENHNVVFDMQSLGTVASALDGPIKASFTGGENEGCAVLVQHPDLGAILAADRCP